MNLQRGRDLTFDGLVHDLNNVFQTIIDSAELIGSDPKWSSVSAILLRSVQQGHRIVSSLACTAPNQTDLSVVLDHAISFTNDLNAATKQPSIEFVRNCQSHLCVDMEAAALERVFINLFVNSAHAAREAGRPDCRVIISASARDGGTEIAITDNGPGIPAAILPVIFEPGISSNPAHEGLGLHIVRSMVSAAGGYVTASNLSPGGAEFRITLPAAARLASVAQAASAARL